MNGAVAVAAVAELRPAGGAAWTLRLVAQLEEERARPLAQRIAGLLRHAGLQLRRLLQQILQIALRRRIHGMKLGKRRGRGQAATAGGGGGVSQQPVAKAEAGAGEQGGHLQQVAVLERLAPRAGGGGGGAKRVKGVQKGAHGGLAFR